MNWIFKKEIVTNVVNEKELAVVELDQKRKFSGETGDRVLILDNDGEWSFIAYMTVTEIQRDTKNIENNKQSIFLKLNQKFDAPKPLEDYIYSLSRINNFSNPSSHFRYKYNRVTDEEFDAIFKDDIYIERTILGTVLNSLHQNHKESFILYLADEYPALLTNKVDSSMALKYLKSYLLGSILMPARYLKECDKLAETLFGNENKVVIGFRNNINSNENLDNMMSRQVDVINKYLPDLDELLIENSKITSQDNFKKLFKNSKLPISLS